MTVKDVVGYEGLYEVSDAGCVWSLNYKRTRKRRQLRPGINKGYHHVVLCLNGKRSVMRVHRLVATAFIKNPENKATVNHKNGKTDDNRLPNLEWATCSENHLHAYRELGRKSVTWCTGSMNIRSKACAQYDQSGMLIEKHESQLQAQKKTGVNNSHICEVILGDRKTAGGFIWRQI